MSVSIVERTLGGETRKCLVLEGPADFAAPFSFGSNWNEIVVAGRFSFQDTGGDILTPALYLGVMSNPNSSLTNMIRHGVSHSHSISAVVGGSTLVRQTSPVIHYTKVIAFGLRQIGASSVTTGFLPDTRSVPANYLNAQSIYMVRIRKGGSNNVAFYTYTDPSLGAFNNVTRQAFLKWFDAHNPLTTHTGAGSHTPYLYSQISASGTAITYNNGTLAIDEATNGPLNAVFASTNVGTIVEFSEIAVYKIR